MDQVFADLSSNNAQFDAAKYRAAGHVFVAIKATEGTGYVNPKHRSWCYAAGLHHIGIAHYHFARPDLGSNPTAEARHFLATALPLAGGRDYLVLDYERHASGGVSRDPAWAKAFDHEVRRSSRFKTILYGSKA